MTKSAMATCSANSGVRRPNRGTAAVTCPPPQTDNPTHTHKNHVCKAGAKYYVMQTKFYYGDWVQNFDPNASAITTRLCAHACPLLTEAYECILQTINKIFCIGGLKAACWTTCKVNRNCTFQEDCGVKKKKENEFITHFSTISCLSLPWDAIDI